MSSLQLTRPDLFLLSQLFKQILQCKTLDLLLYEVIPKQCLSDTIPALVGMLGQNFAATQKVKLGKFTFHLSLELRKSAVATGTSFVYANGGGEELGRESPTVRGVECYLTVKDKHSNSCTGTAKCSARKYVREARRSPLTCRSACRPPSHPAAAAFTPSLPCLAAVKAFFSPYLFYLFHACLLFLEFQKHVM